jgi:hypothetical protein
MEQGGGICVCAEAKKYSLFKWACSVSDYYQRGQQK